MKHDERTTLRALIAMVLAARPELIEREGAAGYIGTVIDVAAQAHSYLYSQRERMRVLLDADEYAIVHKALQFDAITDGSIVVSDAEIMASVDEALELIKREGLMSMGLPGQERGEA